ncbi:phosphatidate cytidylyltransferase [Rosistilla oblonga]|uniref:phosphatidate cytidylyltransferase n=1 Tax=Rosistilla oblonga TaxID=2527990 RepID=UPI003A97FAC2
MICDAALLPLLNSPLLLAVAQMTTSTFWLLGVVVAVLAILLLTGRLLERRQSSMMNPALLQRFNHRVRVWLMMSAILVFAFLMDQFIRGVTVLLFGFVSFWALREFVTMTPTRRGDHRTLFWVFFIFTPLQYVLIALGPAYYGLYSIMIPVYGSLFIPARNALAGDSKRFLERTAKIQVGLLICVYSLSYAPAMLDLNLSSSRKVQWDGSPVSLLFFFILIAQIADVLQQAWNRFAGVHVIAKEINASRTWEGLLGSIVSTGAIGAALWWATPFEWYEAAVMSMIVAMMSSAGTMTLSAIKRDRGVTDTGTLVQGHAGLLDRIDNVCFAAPVFYHLTRYFFSV